MIDHNRAEDVGIRILSNASLSIFVHQAVLRRTPDTRFIRELGYILDDLGMSII